MEPRIISLKDGKQATLKLAVIPVNDKHNQYNITAFDSDKKVVAICRFTIISTYIRELSFEQRTNFAKRTNKSIESVPTFITLELTPAEDEIHNHTITHNNKLYTFRDAVCELNEINIFEDEYHNIGLGTAMLKLVEEISIKHNASKIKGMFFPMGKFQLSSLQFYKRNAFDFTVKDSQTYVVKDLSALNSLDSINIE